MTGDQRTDAQKIMEARHASYADYPSGYMDETDLLLAQQHYGELRAREERKKKKAAHG